VSATGSTCTTCSLDNGLQRFFELRNLQHTQPSAYTCIPVEKTTLWVKGDQSPSLYPMVMWGVAIEESIRTGSPAMV